MSGFTTIRAHAGAPRGQLALAGAAAFLRWSAFAAPGEGAAYTAFLEKSPPKDMEKVHAIDIDGALVVRRALVEGPLAAALAAGKVALRPVAVSSRKASSVPRHEAKLVDEGLCVVDPLVEVAADRRALGPLSFAPEGAHRERAMVVHLDGHPFSEERAPAEEIFRLHDLPWDIWVSRALAQELVKALGGAVVEGRTRPSPPFVSATIARALPVSDAAAEAAAGAYFSSRGGAKGPSKAERARILASPLYAHLLARREGPRDDTRAAACLHPAYALVYARDVERAGRDDTRAAAAKTDETAIRYALEVDRASHPTTRGALATSYRLGEYDEGIARLAPPPAPLARAAKAAPATLHAVALKSQADAHVSVLDAPGRDAAWGLAIEDGDVTVDVRAPSLKAKAYSDSFRGPWVLERALAERMFAGVGSVALRRVTALHRGEPARADLVYVDVLLDLPLDRDAAGATYSDAKRPWSSVARAVTDVRVLAPSGEALLMARVAEFPGILLASAALLERWKKLKAPFRAVPPPQSHLSCLPLFATWDEGPPFPRGEAPVAALRAVLAGDVARRAEAIAHPGFAYAVARLVDRKPAAETRAAALGHPHTAALYARFVDGAPRDDTRAAAARSGPTALFYARYVVDHAVRGPIAAAFKKHGLEMED